MTVEQYVKACSDILKQRELFRVAAIQDGGIPILAGVR
jgi:hypothetical protein